MAFYPRKRRRMSRMSKRRRYSKLRTARMRRIGERIGSQSCRTTVVGLDSGTVKKDGRSLYQQTLISVSKGSAMDQRERNIINVRGIKSEILVKNEFTAPLMLNIAIVSPKADAAITELGVVATKDFFRGYMGKRYQTFSEALSCIEMHYSGINTDIWHVLRHKRYMLGVGAKNSTAYDDPNRPSYRKIKWYLKVRRQVRFEDDSTVPVDGQMYMVFWCDTFGGTPGLTPQQDVLFWADRQTLYFKNPRN